MRHINKYLLLSFLIILSASCKKENDNDDNNNGNEQNTAPAPTTTELKASVDGAEWIAKTESINCAYVSVIGSNTVTIDGEADDGSKISLSLSLWNKKPGTFEIVQVGLSNYVGMNYHSSNSINYSAPTDNSITTGSLTISYWDEQKIRGSFNFVGGQDNSNSTVTITNGIFSVLNVN